MDSILCVFIEVVTGIGGIHAAHRQNVDDCEYCCWNCGPYLWHARRHSSRCKHMMHNTIIYGLQAACKIFSPAQSEENLR